VSEKVLEVDPSRQASRDLQKYLDSFRTGDPRLLQPFAHGDSAQSPKPRLRSKSAIRNALVEQLVHRDSQSGSVGPAAIGLMLDSYYGLRKLAGREPGRGHVLPDFMIVGFQKCGTTSLFDSMCEHPFIKQPTRNGAPGKELYYFDYNYQRREGWYRLHFATDSEREAFTAAQGRPFLTGDATVSTMYHGWAHQRVAKLLPDVKLIVCLRNPVDRAYSGYHHTRKYSWELADTFEEALALEAERIAPLEARASADPYYNPQPPPPLGVWSYLRGSRYAEHLERWLPLFPREQFLFVEFEPMIADPQATLDRIYEFLGLPPHRHGDFPKSNRGGYSTPMAPATREHLVEYFRPHNARVRELTGLDCAWDR
jgi:hypothetical protein